MATTYTLGHFGSFCYLAQGKVNFRCLIPIINQHLGGSEVDHLGGTEVDIRWISR